MVESTRWPVSEAWIAISAVSLSRISPTMMTSGSWRRKARSALANVRPIFGLHVHLVDAADLVLDRILGGEDVAARLVDPVQARVERGRLAAAGRAGDQDDAVRPLDEAVHQARSRARAKPRSVRSSRTMVLCRRRITMRSKPRLVGIVRDADVDALAGDLQRDAPVLRQPLLGDVERRHDLHARDDRAHELLRLARLRDVELAVDAVADDDVALLRLDVDVARALLDRLREEAVDPADDRRVVVGVEDVDEVVLLERVDRSRARRRPPCARRRG